MRLLTFILLTVLLSTTASAQIQIDTKALLEDYSLELFSANAKGFMSPLVIVSNLGANDAFYNRAYVPKRNTLYFDISVRSMVAWVLDEEREFTATLPIDDKPNPHPILSKEWMRVVQLNYFKTQLRGAVAAGELETQVRTATVTRCTSMTGSSCVRAAALRFLRSTSRTMSRASTAPRWRGCRASFR